MASSHAHRALCLSVLLAALLPMPLSVLAQDASVPVESGDPAWARMLALAGRWRLPAPDTPRQTAFRVVLAPVSRGTALEERYGIRVPVLRSADGRELDWPFDVAAVVAFIGSPSGP